VRTPYWAGAGRRSGAQYAGCQDDETILWACFEDCAYGAALCQRQLKTDPLTASEKLTPWLVIGHRCLLLMFGRGLGL
jgi:hypothetical protein